LDNISEKNNKIMDGCGSKLPLWFVILENIPTVSMYIFGTVIVSILSVYIGIILLLYSIITTIIFWAKICTCCIHYGTKACPSGYGYLSSKFFKRQKNKNFKKVFKRYVLLLLPSWFLPVIVGVYLLINDFTIKMFILLAVFSVIAFIIIPLFSKISGCRNCKEKNNCPWMK